MDHGQIQDLLQSPSSEFDGCYSIAALDVYYV